MSTGLCIFLCALSFVAGEIVGAFVIALLSANKEGDNGDK